MLAHPCRPWVTRALAEDLEPMCSGALEVHGPSPPRVGPGGVSRKLRFQGPWHGSFGIDSPLPTAQLAAGEDTDPSGDEEAEEVVGEITNMVCGSFLGLTHTKQHLDLAPPQPNHPWAPESGTTCRVSQAFAVEESVVVSWLKMEPCR